MPFMPRLNCLKISALHIINLATSLMGDLIIIAFVCTNEIDYVVIPRGGIDN